MPVRWAGNPASSKECKDMSKIFNIFAPNNYTELSSDEKSKIRTEVYNKMYNYINWMFDYKCRFGNNSMAVTTQFFLSPYSLNEFQLMYSKAIKNTKSKSKIEDLISWCKQEIPDILENHQLDRGEDIKMIIRYADMHNLQENSVERKLISKAMEMGII